jgi:predicted 3-demethylubiquinone-9 3-methyltransferase (glyoxalase superfamily)
MQKITPFLWFNGCAEEAVNFYISIFKNSFIKSSRRVNVGENGMYNATFVLDGQEFMVLDGGPMYQLSPATSMFVTCETQDEIDYFWEKLSEGGTTSQCGWLHDKFGLTWQIVPAVLESLMNDPDPVKAQNALQAMMSMSKFDIAALKVAHSQN